MKDQTKDLIDVEYRVCEYNHMTDKYYVRAEFSDMDTAKKRMEELYAKYPNLQWALIKRSTTYEVLDK